MTKRFVCPLLLSAILLFGGCSRKKSADPGGAADEAESATPVAVEAVKTATIHETVTAEAVLYPVRQASIMPKVSAPVQKFLVQRGDHVQQGQLLAVLEDRDLVAAAQESRGQYAQVEAAYQTTTGATIPEDQKKAATDLVTAKATVDAARKVYESRQNLLKEGAIAQKLVEDARVALVQAQSQLDVAQQHWNSLETVGRTEQLKSAAAQLEAAKAHLASSEAQVSYAEVRSPIAGIVADRPVSVGEIATNTSALISVVDISQVVARANVPVREAVQMRVGSAATISAAGLDVDGKVVVVSPAVDPNTTTVEIWVQAKNPGEQLKPGVTAQITIQVAAIPDALVVPAAALLSSDEGGDKVMLAGVDSLAHEQAVKVGVREGDYVQVLSGLKAGDRVITQGALGLEDKAKITVSAAGDKDENGASEK